MICSTRLLLFLALVFLAGAPAAAQCVVRSEPLTAVVLSPLSYQGISIVGSCSIPAGTAPTYLTSARADEPMVWSALGLDNYQVKVLRQDEMNAWNSGKAPTRCINSGCETVYSGSQNWTSPPEGIQLQAGDTYFVAVFCLNAYSPYSAFPCSLFVSLDFTSTQPIAVAPQVPYNPQVPAAEPVTMQSYSWGRASVTPNIPACNSSSLPVFVMSRLQNQSSNGFVLSPYEYVGMPADSATFVGQLVYGGTFSIASQKSSAMVCSGSIFIRDTPQRLSFSCSLSSAQACQYEYRTWMPSLPLVTPTLYPVTLAPSVFMPIPSIRALWSYCLNQFEVAVFRQVMPSLGATPPSYERLNFFSLAAFECNEERTSSTLTFTLLDSKGVPNTPALDRAAQAGLPFTTTPGRPSANLFREFYSGQLAAQPIQSQPVSSPAWALLHQNIYQAMSIVLVFCMLTML